MDVAPASCFADLLIAIGGEAGRLIAGRDWSATPLGPVESWQQSLRGAVTTLLASPVPMVMLWGEDGVMLYNDAYSTFAGGRHPDLLGSKVREGWPEVADFNDNVMKVGLAGGTLAYRDQELILTRHGRPEQVWMNLDYSPVFDERGEPAGVLAIVVETTGRVLAERRQAFRLGIETLLRDLDDPVAMVARAAGALGRHLGAARAGFAEVEDDGEHMFVARDWNDGRIPSVAGRWRMDDFGAAFIHDIKAGETIVIPDLSLDARTSAPEVMAAYDGIGTSAILDVPLIRDGRMRALLFVHHPEPRAWTPEEVALVEETGARLWSAIERARAEAALRESEARMSAIFARAAVGLSEITLDGRFARVNDELCAMLGRSREELLGANVADVTHPGDLSRSLESLGRAIETGAAVSIDKRYLRPDGAVVWSGSSLTRLDDERGLPRAVLAVTVDLTERRATQAALAASEAFKRRILQASPDCIKVVDLDGRIEFMNESGLRILEADDPAAYQGARWTDFWQGEDHARAHAALEEGRRGGTGRLNGFASTRKGTPKWWDVAVTAIIGLDGAPDKLLVVSRDVTAAREAGERLRESEEFSRRVLASSDDCIKVIGLDGRLESMSEGGRRALAIDDRGTFIGSDWAESFEPEGRPAARAAVADACAGRTARFEAGLKTQTGDPRWWDTVVSPIAGADGEPEKLLALSRDITDLQRSEDALRELNATLERRVADALAERKVLADIVEATDASVQVVGPDFRFLAINEAARQHYEMIFGVRPSVGQSLLDALAHLPEEREAARQVWARVLGGEAYVETAWWGDGSLGRRAFEMRFRPLVDAQGRQLGAFLFGQDVTLRLNEQERLAAAEAARREADALYRAYFENTAEALFVINVLEDGGFTIEDLNPAHEASVGLPLAELRGRRIDEILPPEAASVVIGHYRRVIEMGEVHQYRETYESPGRTTYWDTVLVPVQDADGRIVRLIGSSRDLTAQLAAEEQLRQAQKMEAMGQLTGGVAHDFNNLLTPIVGSLDLLQRKGIGGERERQMIAGAMQSAERAKTLVQRLLAFARRQPLQPTAIDIGTLVGGMADLVSSTTGPQIHVAVEVAEGLPPAKGDANQLEMALLNLAVNARDAMPEGGTLRIGAGMEAIGRDHRTRLRPGDYVRLSVTDTGTGMDDATLARAIEPFFSTKGIGKGTGLGLSMVHGLAQQLGGALTIQSRRGFGTDVELWLPQSEEALHVADDASEPRTVPGKVGTALLVDDEALVRMSTATMLADLGYEVVEAGSAEAALALVDSGLRPDLLVTDHLMPGMNGTDLARVMRAQQPGTPILLVSGYAEANDVAPDLSRLTKPFRNDELAARLARIIGAAGN